MHLNSQMAFYAEFLSNEQIPLFLFLPYRMNHLLTGACAEGSASSCNTTPCPCFVSAHAPALGVPERMRIGFF